MSFRKQNSDQVPCGLLPYSTHSSGKACHVQVPAKGAHGLALHSCLRTVLLERPWRE